MALLAGSPAIDAGDNSLIPLELTLDQRGAPRVKGKSVDIGAFESGPTTIVVTTLADEDDGSIDPSSGIGTSLRDAISFANADPGGGDTITFSPLLEGAVDLSLGALPTITTAMAIDGPGANVLSVNGQGQSRILSVGTGADVTISGLTLADGRASTGGGIINRGKLTLTDCTLSGNTATAFGGGLYNIGTLTMTGCTLSGNTATVLGGGLYSKYFPIGSDFGTAALTDCTVSGNTAPSSAGLSLAYGTNTLVNCTVSANTATASQRGLAAGLNSFGAMTLENTIVAGNTGPSGASDLGGRGTASASNSLVGTGSVTGSARPARRHQAHARPTRLERRPDPDHGLAPRQPRHRQGYRDRGRDHRPARPPARLAGRRHRRLPVPGPAADREDLRADHGDRPG